MGKGQEAVAEFAMLPVRAAPAVASGIRETASDGTIRIREWPPRPKQPQRAPIADRLPVRVTD